MNKARGNAVKASRPKARSTNAKTISKAKVATATPSLAAHSQKLFKPIWLFLRSHWLGTILIALATTVFFWPLIIRAGSYSEGGDAMFNAWILGRNHHCIMRQGCSQYSDANIYFPHKDTMLYSETELSAGLLTLPLHFINPNPIFSYNVLTIVSFFLSGWFMYLLAKRLSKGHELFSIMAGLIFEFAPLKMASVSHLQNLSIFYLPLILLLIFKFIDKHNNKWYLFGLFMALALQFHASWYQMVFVLIALFVFLGGMFLFKLAGPKVLGALAITIVLAIITTLPLAKEYTRFSKQNQATFTLQDQLTYSADVRDYFIPHTNTLLGRIYYKLKPAAQKNSFNPDSYSYHGMILYAVAVAVTIAAFLRRKRSEDEDRQYKYVVITGVLFLIGLVMSLGPILKINGKTPDIFIDGATKVLVPLPYLAVDALVPQLSFIRAIGRASVLSLLALCITLALFPIILRKSSIKTGYKRAITAVVCLLIIFELMPTTRMGMVSNAYGYNLTIPDVYKVIKNNKDIDDIVILSADKDYPGAPIPVARAEQVLWSGYHNKNIFNGYSGYTPPSYFTDYDDFVDFHKDDIPKLKKNKLRYVLVDKQLSSTRPRLVKNVSEALPNKVYEDSRYALFKI